MTCAGWNCGRTPTVVLGDTEALCRRHAIAEADRLARIAVMLRDRGRCRSCGAEGNSLDWAHIVTRASGVYIRWDVDAAVALCRGCHGTFTAQPSSFARFIAQTFDPEHMNRLRMREHLAERRGGHVDLAAIIEGFRADEFTPADKAR